MERVTRSAGETQKLARVLAKKMLRTLTARALSHALVVSLEGNLGSGKTTFTQGFAKGLGIKEKILSPTFVLMKRFHIGHTHVLYHLDCYRLETSKDIIAIGFRDILKDPSAMVLAEWGDRVKSVFPKHRVTIRFSHTKKPNERRIRVTQNVIVFGPVVPK